MPKGVPRDKNLDCPAVRTFRDIIHLQLNYLQRQYVAENVQCTERGLRIWRAILTEQMLTGRNPKNVPYMVKLWEGIYYDPARHDPCWKDTTEKVEPDSGQMWRD